MSDNNPAELSAERVGQLWDEGVASGRAERQMTAAEICAEGQARIARGSRLFSDLWSRQQGRCAICGKGMPAHRGEVPHATVWKKKRATFDHIRPRVKGGKDEAENLQLAHAECNWRKGDSWRG
jgi:hypothetical protein